MLRIVAADDSEIMLSRVERIIRNAGHDLVATANNGRDAVNLCKEHYPDIVILDITMPGGPGDLAAHAILDEKTATHVILASNQGNDAVLAPLKARGAAFCGKPFEAHKLLNIIARLTDGAQ